MRLEKLGSFVSTDALVKQQKDFYNDKEEIDKMCDIIGTSEVTAEDATTQICSLMKLSKFKCERLLKDYEGKKWRVGKNSGTYKLIKVLKHDEDE